MNSRLMKPKLGPSGPPQVEVITRPCHSGQTATRAPSLLLNSMTLRVPRQEILGRAVRRQRRRRLRTASRTITRADCSGHTKPS